MNIARFADGTTQRWGFVDDDGVWAAPDGMALMAALADRTMLARARAEAAAPTPLTSVKLLAPIPEPPQFIGVGLNYRAHAEEAGFDIPTVPVTFPFHRSAIIGTGEPIEIPSLSQQIDWEAELAIVIGSGGRDIAKDDALDHVAGYTIINDVSARDIQMADGQWSRAKSFDSFKPMGPWITTVDELGAASDLDVALTVNGIVKQSGTTSDLIFPIAEVVSYISMATTLLPGSVIPTGTPAGVGFSRKPPQFLKPGDTVTVTISGIGQLTNPVR